MSLAAEERPADALKLQSLRGTMFTVMGDDGEGLPFKIWAKGNKMRTEITFGATKVVALQIGDTLYTYDEDSKTGKKERIAVGLSSMPLIKQISEVKANGERAGSEEIDGEEHHEYVYKKNAPGALAIVYIGVKTSLPRIWISLIRAKDGTASRMTMYFRDLEANVEIPDKMFALPKGVTFSD